MDTTSTPTSRDTPSLAAGLSDLAAVAPDLNLTQWGRIGAGAALALVGSGVLSLGTVIRLAAVFGGAAVVYQTLTSASSEAKTEGADAGSPSKLTASAWAARPSLREAPPVHDADNDGATMEGTEPIPFGTLRGS